MAKRLTVLRVSRAIQRLEEVILSEAMLVIAALTVLNVVSRSVFDHSLAFAEELSQFLIVAVVFLGLSYGAARGRHIRMTAIYDAFGQRTRKALTLIISATTSALMFFLAYHALQYVQIMARLGSVSPVLQVPLYIVYLAAPIGLTLAGIRYAATLIRNLREPDIYLSYTVPEEQEEPVRGEI